MQNKNSANRIILLNSNLFANKKIILVNPDDSFAVLELKSIFKDICVISNDWSIHKSLMAQSIKVYSLQQAQNIDKEFSTAIIFWSKNKQESWNYIVDMRNLVTDLYLAGGNKSGIKNIFSKLSELGIKVSKLSSARHAQLYQVLDFEQHMAKYSAEHFIYRELNIVTNVGVFSQGRLDKGSEFLLDYLTKNRLAFKQKILDVGCGSGILAAVLLHENMAKEAIGVDKNLLAVESANATYRENKLNAKAYASDIFSDLPASKFDLIISNPPFHENFKTSTEFMQEFVQQSKSWLSNKGELIIVANAFLPYAKIFAANFQNWRQLDANSSYKIYWAQI